MRYVNIIAFILVVIGALNWGLVGAFNVDLVAALFGPISTLSRVIYVLVGLSGLYCIFLSKHYLNHHHHD